MIAELLLVSGVRKSHTTPYHPMGNGQTERFNRTLGNMIRSLPPRLKERWPQMIQTLTFSYNCTTHETTGFAPFYLMFGRVPRLPVDIMFGSALRNDDVQTYDEYVETFQRDLREAIRIAQGNTTGAQRRQAQEYNKKSKGVALEVGDRVLLVNKKEKGKRKLADVWDSVVHVVTWKDPTLHIYRVEDPTTRKSKVVHRNFLLPVNFLPLEKPEVESTMFSTVSEEEISETKDEEHRSLLSSELRSRRIAAWVLQGQGPKPSQPVGAHSVQGQGIWQVRGVHASASTDHMRHGGPLITNGGSKPSKLSSNCDTDDVQESEWSADDLSSASETDLASEGIDEEDRPGGSVNGHGVQAEPVTMPRESSSEKQIRSLLKVSSPK